MWIWGEGAGGVVAQKLREYTSFRRLKNGPDDNFSSFVFYYEYVYEYANHLHLLLDSCC